MALKDTLSEVFENSPEGLALAKQLLPIKQDIASNTAGVASKQNSAFVPDESTDWDPAPIQKALDQLAARVKALEP